MATTSRGYRKLNDNVPNKPAAVNLALEDINTDVGTVATTAGAATAAAAAAQAAIDGHEADTANPHGVTAAQVGLGNADNTSDLDKPISTATQTALDGKQPLHANLTALSGLAWAADTFGYFTGAGAAALATVTSFGRSLLAAADAAAVRALLGLGGGALLEDAIIRLSRGDYYVALGLFNLNATPPSDYVSGTGAGKVASANGTHALMKPGFSSFTGTTATGIHGYILSNGIYGTSNSAIALNSFSYLDTSMRVQIPTLSTGAETFTVVYGITARTAATDAVSTGAYFQVDGADLKCVTHNGTTSTVYTWPTAVVAGQVYGFRIRYTSSAVEFYVDNTLIVTISTTVPAAVGVKIECYIQKSVGTTSRFANWARAQIIGKYTDAAA